jgi:hypothetical protein
MLNCAWVSQRLDVAEVLLRSRHFEQALAIACDVDAELTKGAASLPPLVRIPQRVLDRAQDVRRAAEMGTHIGAVAQDGSRTPRRRMGVLDALERSL